MRSNISKTQIHTHTHTKKKKEGRSEEIEIKKERKWQNAFPNENINIDTNIDFLLIHNKWKMESMQWLTQGYGSVTADESTCFQYQDN